MAAPRTDDAALTAAERELDRLASEVARRAASGTGTGTAGTPERWAWALRDVLGARHGFHGRAADYDRLESSLLAAVLRRRSGLPILLSVVWTEVGRRAGAPVHGVGRPGHFVAGVGDPAGHRLLVDPFNGGVPLSPADAIGSPGAAGALETVSRILNNIRAWAATRPEHSAVALWALDLALLLPRHPARLRLERARLLVRRGEFIGGAVALESYAEVINGIDPPAATALRHEARSARALLN
nr:transglutaminase-like domain-containing protein [Streptantibioticus silvisoli]